jgi:hypothetical protein
MDQTRLIRGAILRLALAALLGAAASFSPGRQTNEPSPEGRSEWEHFSGRCASDSLRTLTSAEADFRANDRDWCNVSGSWTTDTTGPYTLIETADSAIRLIELSIASADTDEESPD